MKKMNTKAFGSIGLCAMLLFGILLISGCANKETTPTEPETLVPDDSPQLPSRGFFMGVLPTTAQGQSFDDAYAQAAQHSEFVPVWGSPTPFYNLAEDLSGSWGKLLSKNSFVAMECSP